MGVETGKQIEVFFSYSHRDEDLRDELAKHLSILKRQGVISAWHDRQITDGSEWAGEIDTHLSSADIILLLISADFIASDYCWDIELKQAMERHEAKEACVIPVILRPSDWHGAPFGKLQALPKNAQPVTSWTNRDEAFLNVAQGIRRTVEHMVATQSQPSTQTSRISPQYPREGLTGRQRQRLEQEREGLQQHYDLLSEKLQRLRDASAIETDASNRFKLEKQMEQVEMERNQLEGSLDELDQRLQ